MSYNPIDVYFDGSIKELNELVKHLSKVGDDSIKSTNFMADELLKSLNTSMLKNMQEINSIMSDLINKSFASLDTSKMLKPLQHSLSETLKPLLNLPQANSTIVLSKESTENVKEIINKAVSAIPDNNNDNTALSNNPEIKTAKNKKFWTLENVYYLLSILIFLYQIISWFLPEKEAKPDNITVNQTININHCTNNEPVKNECEIQQIQEEINVAIQKVIKSINENTQEITDDSDSEVPISTD